MTKTSVNQVRKDMRRLRVTEDFMDDRGMKCEAVGEVISKLGFEWLAR